MFNSLKPSEFCATSLFASRFVRNCTVIFRRCASLTRILASLKKTSCFKRRRWPIQQNQTLFWPSKSDDRQDEMARRNAARTPADEAECGEGNEVSVISHRRGRCFPTCSAKAHRPAGRRSRRRSRSLWMYAAAPWSFSKQVLGSFLILRVVPLVLPRFSHRRVGLGSAAPSSAPRSSFLVLSTRCPRHRREAKLARTLRITPIRICLRLLCAVVSLRFRGRPLCTCISMLFVASCVCFPCPRQAPPEQGLLLSPHD